MWERYEIEAFCMKHLPWIASATGMKWSGKLPALVGIPNEEFNNLTDESCYMAFCPPMNTIIYRSSPHPKAVEKGVDEKSWFKSALIHELVHFLQKENGTEAMPKDGYKALAKTELQAYSIQARFLWDKLGIDPCEHHLDQKGIQRGVFMSCAGALGKVKESA